MAKLILLDRDGVINFDSPESIRSADEWIAIPGSLEAIVELKQSGRRVGVCSNQSGIGKGLFTEEDLVSIETRLNDELRALGTSIDFFCYCPHPPGSDCLCRKPKPGMLNDAMRALKVDPEDTCFVGDSRRDIDAALAAGCEPVLVLTGNGVRTRDNETADLTGLRIYPDLAAFAHAELLEA